MRTAAFRTLLGLLAVALAACGGGGQPQPDLSLAGISPQDPIVVQGQSVDLTLTFTSQSGFQGVVSLSVTDRQTDQAPSWLTLSPTSKNLKVPKGGQVQETLQVQVAANAPTGSHALRLKATYGNRTAERDLALTVTAEPGTIWTVRPTEFRACRVAYGDGTFVAAGIGLTSIFVSQDRGQTWTVKPRLVSDNIWDVAYGNGIFVVAMGTGWVMVSRDRGETWRLDSEIGFDFDFIAITHYDNGTFVLQAKDLGYSYSIATITFSTDGSTWAWKNRFGIPPSGHFNSITYGGGTLVGVGYYGAILASTDGGRTWTTVPSGTDATLMRVTYGDGLFVAVGAGGTILTSRDGVAWRRQESGTDADLCAVAYGGGIFLALGNGVVLTSP